MIPAVLTQPDNEGIGAMMAKDRDPRSAGGWLSRLVRPGVKAAEPKRDTPDHLWVKCPATGEMVYRPDLEAQMWVTPAGHHMRIGAALRLRYTFDNGAYTPIALPEVVEDPLSFSDDKPYKQRLAAARKAQGVKDTMSAGQGLIGGHGAVVLVQDFAFMGGSLGMAAGEGFIRAAEAAVAAGLPFIAFTAAGGARMQEGILSLMQMPRTTLAIQMLRDAGLPYIVVLTDPTTGGVTASYAMLGDVHLAEPGALIGFAGPRVIEQTIREKLPPGFQRSEYLLDKGMVDVVAHRRDLPVVLARLIRALMAQKSAPSARG